MLASAHGRLSLAEYGSLGMAELGMLNGRQAPGISDGAGLQGAALSCGH